MRARVLLRLGVLVALSAATAVAYVNRAQMGGDAMQAWIGQAGRMGPWLFVVAYALATVLFMPGSVITLAAGAIFGPILGAICSLAGASLGAVAAFMIARYAAGDWVGRRSRGWLDQVVRGVEHEGWRFVAFVRLMPVFPFNALNYGLGLTRIPLAQYAAATFVCMAPGAFAYAYLGSVGREAAEGGANVVGKLVMAAGMVAALVFLPRLIRRLRTARETGPAHGPRAISRTGSPHFGSEP